MAERKTFLLRIDPELWAELESWAQAELRSVNGQVEYLLREAVQRRRGGPRALRSPVARRSPRSAAGSAPPGSATATPSAVDVASPGSTPPSPSTSSASSADPAEPPDVSPAPFSPTFD